MSYEYFRLEMESETAADKCIDFLNRANVGRLENTIRDIRREGSIVEVVFDPPAPDGDMAIFEQLVIGFKYGFRAGFKAGAKSNSTSQKIESGIDSQT